jgi:NAD(P)-dependent dehydrogenase (short-subunit alcohol dehydrogenase family)
MLRPRGRHRWTAVPRQERRTFVVTGASSGIGLQAARVLAAFGGHVVLAVRNTDKGRSVASALRADVEGASVEVRRLDVSDLASVRSFAEQTARVDVLVNNAGIMAVPLARTVDGFESQLGTNHLGHFALTNLLLPKLADRVVVVGSAAHRSGSVDLDDLNWERRPYRPYAAYAQSKLANLLFLAELQRRLTACGSTLRTTGAHPGYTSTALTGGTGSRVFTRVSDLGNRLVGMPAWQGAMSTVYAATMDLPGNSYVGPHGPGEMLGWPTLVGRSPDASDPELAKALWSRSEELTATPFPL